MALLSMALAADRRREANPARTGGRPPVSAAVQSLVSREAKARLARSFPLTILRLFRQVPTAPDRALAGVGLLRLSCVDGPVRVRFVLEAGVAGTIAGVAAVNFQIVGAEGDCHARILAWQCGRFATYACHMCAMIAVTD